jgi:hypothetical protein
MPSLPSLQSVLEDPRWLSAGAGTLALLLLAVWIGRYWARRTRRKRLLKRLSRISYEAAHQVLVPDGMGGHFHVDHLLLTARGLVVLDMRRVGGVIFGGDQMTEWTVMTRSRRTTFENPQPPLYDRVAAVKALAGDCAVEGRLVFSTDGKFAKGMPKWVVTLAGLDVEFPPADRAVPPANFASMQHSWAQIIAAVQPSPHQPGDF